MSIGPGLIGDFAKQQGNPRSKREPWVLLPRLENWCRANAGLVQLLNFAALVAMNVQLFRLFRLLRTWLACE